MKPNATAARNAIQADSVHKHTIVFDNRAPIFNKYTPAYAVSNENVHDVVQKFIPKCNPSVLTVAASGDHPLICRLNGAKNITTFDISYNARVIMDIKTAAIHKLNIGEYSRLLDNLYRTQNVLSVPDIEKIVPQLKSTIRNYIRKTNGVRLFSNGFGPQSYARYAIMPSEYKKLQNMEYKPFPFIWSGIKDLDLHDNMYDFVHLSNVLDYVPYDDLTPIIKNIQNHVNIGGRIVILSMTSMSTKICLQYLIKRQINWRMLESGRLNVLERIR